MSNLSNPMQKIYIQIYFDQDGFTIENYLTNYPDNTIQDTAYEQLLNDYFDIISSCEIPSTQPILMLLTYDIVEEIDYYTPDNTTVYLENCTILEATMP